MLVLKHFEEGTMVCGSVAAYMDVVFGRWSALELRKSFNVCLGVESMLNYGAR